MRTGLQSKEGGQERRKEERERYIDRQTERHKEKRDREKKDRERHRKSEIETETVQV